MEQTEIELFKQHLEEKTKLMDSSIAAYVSAVGKFVRENEDHLDDIEYYNNFILNHCIKKKNSLYYEALRKYIRFHIEDTVLKTKMLRLLEKPREQDITRRRRYLSVEERKRVISWMDSHKHRLMARIQFYTGARAREIITLKRGEIRYEPYQIEKDKSRMVMQLMIVGKGGKKAPIWIYDEELAQDIDSYTMSNMPLDYEYYFMDRKFSNSLLTAIKTNYHWYWADLKNALVKCGYKMEDWASHDFRRNSATDVWNMSKDPLTVSRYLRHKQFETTIRYLNNAGLQNRDMSQKLEKLYNNQ